jgi:hypothetical protein
MIVSSQTPSSQVDRTPIVISRPVSHRYSRIRVRPTQESRPRVDENDAVGPERSVPTSAAHDLRRVPRNPPGPE